MHRFALLIAFSLLAGCVSRAPCPAVLTDIGSANGGNAALASTSDEALQCLAGRGDKSAQLELGIRYDEGRGVAADPARAASLYAAAAAFTSGTIFIYSPPVGASPGRTLPYRTGPDQSGLPEAMYRLALLRLEGRGVAQDSAKARQLLERSAQAGNQQAASKLAAITP